MIEYMSDLGLSISYKKVMKIENGLGNMIVEKQNSNEGVYIPDNLTQNLTLRTIQQMANMNFTEPLQSFFRKNKTKSKRKKHRNYTNK